jgi:hypothetical protein
MKKISFKTAFFGLTGLGACAYAILRAPRYLYNGEVQLCEAGTPLAGLSNDCTALFLRRGSGNGKIFAPFSGVVRKSLQIESENFLEIESLSGPEIFTFKIRGTASLAQGSSFKAGQLIAQGERVKVNCYRKEGNYLAPMSPSSYLVANALRPASIDSGKWCEDMSQLLVPSCEGVTFRAPALPKYSFRTIRLTLK